METIKEFLSVGSGWGSGEGSGWGEGSGSGSGEGSGWGEGSGSGEGSGWGSGRGSGSGSGSGSGDGSGWGSGWGSGSGSGSGEGSGWGSGRGSGSGWGDGSGSGEGIKSYNKRRVYMIDGVPTLLDKVRRGFGFGYILNNDLTLTPCRVAKQGNVFAHGRTLKEARDALLEKMFDDMPEDDRIAAFWQAHDRETKYSGRDLWEWHHRLTGSCEMGRNQFARDHGIDIDNSSFTVAEFVELCKNAYGGEIIKRLGEEGET